MLSTVLASTGMSPGTQDLDFATNCHVTGSWVTEPRLKSVLEVMDPKDVPVFVGEGVSGSFSFTASDPPYLFSSISYGNETLSFVNGTCAQPWHPLVPSAI